MSIVSVTEARTALYQLVDAIVVPEATRNRDKCDPARLYSAQEWHAIMAILDDLIRPSRRESLIEAVQTPFNDADDEQG